MEEQTNPMSQPEQPTQPAEPQPTQESGQEGGGNEDKDIQENKAITILSYLGILCLVPLLAKKESKFAQFHAKQGLVLFVVEIIGSFLVPLLGLGLLVYLAALIFSVIGIVNVVGGKMAKLPLIGDLAEKFNL